MKTLLILTFLVSNLIAQETIDISVKGISNTKNDGSQQDRLEAILDAKRQACEKAGVKLKSETTVENFQVKFDYIESKAEAILLPGFQVIDIGYVQDGTYQVVLSGKIKTVVEEQISAKELRYAKTLFDKGDHSQSRKILEKYINNDDPEVSEALKEESFYLYIKWGYAFNVEQECEKFTAFYPESRNAAKIASFGKFASNPVLQLSESFEKNEDDWIEGNWQIKSETYSKKIEAFKEEKIITDSHGGKIPLFVEFSLFQKEDDKSQKPVAYLLKLSYKNGGEIKVIDERFKEFSQKGSKTFQHSSSGKWFKYFSLKNYMIKGDVPFDSETYKYSLSFNVYQKGF
ncbi:MAG: hypothetical protein D8M58_09590 [Calditrichaeota bacterium]|nr:MAG: hypothetical protein DWQ03_08965 [Calditrichota bacterium]MBL1205640.1 hypothetical protein [Calditrichota bacterium]NOG45468.1 hypothetical protein [Calditrichota bacterium]